MINYIIMNIFIIMIIIIKYYHDNIIKIIMIGQLCDYDYDFNYDDNSKIL